MRRNWLLYLVIFSLALNVGTIGTFAYLRYKDRQKEALRREFPPMPIREVWKRLNLDREQRRTLRQLIPEHRHRIRELRWNLAQKRRELFVLLKSDEPPAWPAVQTKIREISDFQGKLEEEVVRHLLTVRKHLTPEQRAVFVNLVEKRLQPFARRRGRPWGRHGPHRGRGPGPPPGMRMGPPDMEHPPPPPPPPPPEAR